MVLYVDNQSNLNLTVDIYLILKQHIQFVLCSYDFFKLFSTSSEYEIETTFNIQDPSDLLVLYMCWGDMDYTRVSLRYRLHPASTIIHIRTGGTGRPSGNRRGVRRLGACQDAEYYILLQSRIN